MCSRGWRASRPESRRASTRVRTPGGVRHVGREATWAWKPHGPGSHMGLEATWAGKTRGPGSHLKRGGTREAHAPFAGARFGTAASAHANGGSPEPVPVPSWRTLSSVRMRSCGPGDGQMGIDPDSEQLGSTRASTQVRTPGGVRHMGDSRGTGARQSLRTRRVRRRAQPGWRSEETSSERRAGCPQRTSGDGAWVAPDHARRGSNRRRLKRRRRPESHRAR